MFVSFLTLSLATSALVHSGVALDVDVKDVQSIKDVAKTLAGGIVAKYETELTGEEGVPGLFGDPYYWWESGAVFGTLVDYSYLTGDKEYDALVGEALNHQIGDGDMDAFLPANQTRNLANDDQSTWGLAAIAAAEAGFPTEKIGSLKWIDLAKNVFDTQVNRWDDETCDGGLRWQIYQFNNGFTYKNSLSTGNFFLLASRLAKFTGNSTYSEWAEKSFKWTQDVGLVDDEFHVYDGTDVTTDCGDINKIQWSANLAVFTEGAAHLYNATKGSDKWKTIVTGLVDKTSVFQVKEGAVLRETACELNGKCNVDQRAFKGLAARSFARAAISAPFVAEDLTAILEISAQGAASGCNGEGEKLKCKLRWNGDGSEDAGLGEAFSALAVVQGLLANPPLAALASGNGTATGNSTTSPSAHSGSAQLPAENEGAASLITMSHGLVFAVAALAFASL